MRRARPRQSSVRARLQLPLVHELWSAWRSLRTVFVVPVWSAIQVEILRVDRLLADDLALLGSSEAEIDRTAPTGPADDLNRAQSPGALPIGF
jgi:hypothetical protein